MATASRGFGATLVRLPPSIHGEGEYTFTLHSITVAVRKAFSSTVVPALDLQQDGFLLGVNSHIYVRLSMKSQRF